ncbi:hypothetical protein B9Q03_05120 [Candidatus Marsarchaeota G2 archaeon OSP_D]|jgi:hypothetical protein|uniref:Uncharacterized protein n=5 Tax=Candidatus Marsarchaeota group 2 TaxID=2203771 RepID=A0A2R6B831_9ARCH|nr:MAG: hypothetical protein B9Q03_05120 [Candidatus Marsarchaeota G2 archaeon OSP_D]PSN94786.1 MAG: hypothetical protein B9Q06_07895 [Candidatus Marsarchaeota G2 archaeon ECH_B_2]PSN97064.1 MAG: hypothetical protein B9Q09_01485 [Candidatus Marsarchaeota G2 archaeon ECH_B_SAG-C16]PSN99247.1 MAG: hypothetical protein B9Q07_07370 [Candidatus Marsarchaeota G2 archaeon ECH_B_3]PSO01570.1 MAG: hypothetical protein B9Q05_08525 [Candidatus Marsarchaeota G2 archaeon ECH_B_1]
MNRVAPIALLIILFALQAVVLFIVSSVNPTTITGQRIAGLTLGVDMLIFAGFISLFQRNFSKPVYSKEDEEHIEE